MRVQKILLTLATTLLFIATIAVVGLAWLMYSPRQVPRGQPALSRLDATALPALRHAFNAASAETRVLLLFSPT